MDDPFDTNPARPPSLRSLPFLSAWKTDPRLSWWEWATIGLVVVSIASALGVL